MDIATLSSKGQITIPKAVREALGLKYGNKIVIQQEENGRFYFDDADLVVFSRPTNSAKNGAEKDTIKSTAWNNLLENTSD